MEYYLFGSRARGDARCDSDYDLIIIGHISDAHYRELYENSIEMGGKLDVFYYDGVSLRALFSSNRAIIGKAVNDCLKEAVKITEVPL